MAADAVRSPAPRLRTRSQRRLDGLSDAALIAEARAGSVGAFGLLYEVHRPAAVARARRLLGGRARSEAEDIVEITFASVFDAIRNGSGPTDHFARYLMVALRHTTWRVDHRRRREPLIDPEALERRRTGADGVGPDGPAGAAAGELASGGEPRASDPGAIDESSLLAAAFRNLNERHRSVLWLTEVEGYDSAEIAPMLGLSANASAALTYRARQALRGSYFTTYATTAAAPACVPLVPQLRAFAEAGQQGPGFDDVESHLTGCARCRDVLRGVAGAGTALRAIGPFGVLWSALWLDPRRDPTDRGAAAGWLSARRAAVGVVAAMVLLAGATLLGGPDGSPLGAPRDRTGTARSAPEDQATVISSSPSTSSATAPEAPAPTPETSVAPPAAPGADPTQGEPGPTGGRVPGSGPPRRPGPSPSVTTTTLPAGSSGSIRPATGGVAGALTQDPDGGGPRPEEAAAGVPVALVGPGGTTVVTTDVRGRFVASGLVPGRYRIDAVVPLGLGPGTPSRHTPTQEGAAVEIGQVQIRSGAVEPVDLRLAPRRALQIEGGGADRSQLAPGEVAAWSFRLRSRGGATDDVTATFAVTVPGRDAIEVVGVEVRSDGPGAASPGTRRLACTVDRRDDRSLVVSCPVGRVTGEATELQLVVRHRGGARGAVRPAVQAGPRTGFARSAERSGSSVELA